ncbi:MAG: di-heme oxidoredictase family protein [Myxococcota bacterium]
MKPNKAAALAVLLGLAACGPASSGLTLRQEDGSDQPLRGLDAHWGARFLEGDALFDTPFRETDGLGPVYIRTSCGGCHEAATRGPGFVERMVQVDAAGEPVPGMPALPYGTVVRPFATGGARPLLAPERADVRMHQRAGIPVMGRGWLEAIAERELLRVEAEQARRTDGVSGRVNRVTWSSRANPTSPFHAHQPGDVVIGRFGLKARQPTLDDFTADALQGDMGVTSALRPNELPNPDGRTDDAKAGEDVDAALVNAIADYVRLIAIPPRKDTGPRGPALFARANCDACHVPSLRTRADYPIPQLADADAPVFTDLLLHDMGPSLADGLSDGEATGREWRTAPLIGLRFLKAFLHDGRAATLDEAVRQHGAEGSEAKASVDLYLALSEDDRTALVHYLSSL